MNNLVLLRTITVHRYIDSHNMRQNETEHVFFYSALSFSQDVLISSTFTMTTS